MEVESSPLYGSVLVMDSILSIVKTLLGPNPQAKLILEASGEGTITTNTMEVLNLISIRHPSIQILREVCVGQKKSVGTGITTLVALCTLLLKHISALLESGLPTALCIKTLYLCLSKCNNVINKHSIPIFLRSLPPNLMINSFGSGLVPIACSWSSLGSCLAHGSELEMELAISVFQFRELTLKGKDFTIDDLCSTNNINVLKIIGSASIQPLVFPGLVLPVSALQRAYVQDLLGKRLNNTVLRIALVLDSLMPTSKVDFREREEKETVYVLEVVNICKTLNINIIVNYNKVVHPRVLEALSAISVLVISGQSLLTMNSLVTLSNAGIVQNINHLKEPHVGLMNFNYLEAGSLVEGPRLKHNRSLHKDCLYLLCKPASQAVNDSPLSVVLAANTVSVLDNMEHKFWTCFHRLKNSIKCGKVLPGAGAIEILCVKELLSQQNQDLVVSAFSESLKGLVEITLENAGYNLSEASTMASESRAPLNVLKSSTIEIFDDYTAKLSCFRLAVEIVHMLIKTGNIVTNNVNKHTS